MNDNQKEELNELINALKKTNTKSYDIINNASKAGVMLFVGVLVSKLTIALAATTLFGFVIFAAPVGLVISLTLASVLFVWLLMKIIGSSEKTKLSKEKWKKDAQKKIKSLLIKSNKNGEVDKSAKLNIFLDKVQSAVKFNMISVENSKEMISSYINDELSHERAMSMLAVTDSRTENITL